MIELRYIYRDGSDHGSLQYRYRLTTNEALQSKEWSNWKFVPGIIVSTSEFDRIQKESIENG